MKPIKTIIIKLVIKLVSFSVFCSAKRELFLLVINVKFENKRKK